MRCRSVKNKAGFTLIELLVVISIIALLLSIILPSLTQVKEQAKKVLCASNLHQMHLALVAYAEDWDSKLPPHENAPTQDHYAQTFPQSAYWIGRFSGYLYGNNPVDEHHPLYWESEFYKSYLPNIETLFCPSNKKAAEEWWRNSGSLVYFYFGNFRGDDGGTWLGDREKEKMPKKTTDRGTWMLMADSCWITTDNIFEGFNHKTPKPDGHNVLRLSGDAGYEKLDLTIWGSNHRYIANGYYNLFW